jgi:hypothetical protein
MKNPNYTFERKENEKIAKYFNLGGGDTSPIDAGYPITYNNNDNTTLHSN